MAIPDYQTLMLPFLELVSDGKRYHFRNDIIESLAAKFSISAEEREIMLPSGQYRVFDSRVGWAKTYLKKAGLIDQPERSIVVISQEGKKLLQTRPKLIDNNILRKYESFNEFQGKTKTSEGVESIDKMIAISPPSHIQTPTERITSAFEEIYSELLQQIIERLSQISPARFERLVVELLVKMGYGGALPDAGKMTKHSGDEGIDGVIKEDKLGLDMIYLQAKRWNNTTVGRPEIQKFVGALAGQKAQKGVFITTSAFSKEAREYAANLQQKVVLIDGKQLAELMIEYDLGVAVAQTYLIKRVDNDYFDENVD